MRDVISNNLASKIDGKVVVDLLDAYEALVSAFRKGDADTCLKQSGKFVEHALRAIEFIRTKTAPSEIKSVAATVKVIFEDKSLPEPIRVLVPRVAQAMVYDLRSKRNSVHVKEVDPRQIDAALCVSAASWLIAELIRIYHVDDEREVAKAMASLTSRHIPLVEAFGDEIVVTSSVDAEIEMLLLLAQSPPGSLDRRAVGKLMGTRSAVATTRAFMKLQNARYLHKTRDGKLHVTGPGQAFLAAEVAKLGIWTLPSA